MKRALASRHRLVVSGLAALAAAAACAGAGGAALPLAPLSSVAKLVPAPPPGPLGPENVAVPAGKVFAPVRSVTLGQTIDGIKCQRTETVVYHVHAHLTIFAGSVAYRVPYGIGIGAPLSGVNTTAGPFVENGSCFMWLHTHASDGVIHIESPSPRIYTLGQFFAVWGQKLAATQVGPFTGKVTAFYDGKVWTADPAKIPLTGETQVQLDIGAPVVAPEHIVFPSGLANVMKKAKK